MKRKFPNATQTQLLAAAQTNHEASSPEQVIDVFLFYVLELYFLTVSFNNPGNEAMFIVMANQAKISSSLGLDVFHPMRDESALNQPRSSQWGLYELLPLNAELFDSFQEAFSGLDPDTGTPVYSSASVFTLKTLGMSPPVK